LQQSQHSQHSVQSQSGQSHLTDIGVPPRTVDRWCARPDANLHGGAGQPGRPVRGAPASRLL